jgi:hypothetical protein
MTMPTSRQQYISFVANRARIMLGEFGPLAQTDVLWNGTPDYDTLITQAEIDTVPNLADAGLTVQQLADAIYALSVIKSTIFDHLPALAFLSSLL